VISSRIGHALDPIILRTFQALFAGRSLNPNVLTVIGAGFALPAFISIAFGHFTTGAVFLLVSGLFDLMDGALARGTNRVTIFGGFLDSVLDRYSDLLIMCGILIYFMSHGAHLEVIATFIASIGVAVIPYARARAEAARLSCSTGLLERPERLLLIICGLFFNLLGYAIFLLAIFTHVTVIQRVLYVRRMSGG
jgi:phosphatidylglycerophosphate synthase